MYLDVRSLVESETDYTRRTPPPFTVASSLYWLTSSAKALVLLIKDPNVHYQLGGLDLTINNDPNGPKA